MSKYRIEVTEHTIYEVEADSDQEAYHALWDRDEGIVIKQSTGTDNIDLWEGEDDG